MGEIIDGKKMAKQIREEIAEEVKSLPEKPGLAVIQAGDNPASTTYVKHKEKDCGEIGFYSEIHRLPESTGQNELVELIMKLNDRENIHGIIVQLPLPGGISEEAAINSVSPDKDVDGFTYISAGRLFTGNNGLVACTPAGCIEIIKSTGTEIKGKNAVIIGRSNIVGKPMAMLLMQNHATVTICHSRTTGLEKTAAGADILVSAIGRPKFVKQDMVKEGAVVIDVGMNRDENNKLCGDVDFDAVKEKAAYITPVPGGVGPMTRAMLMKNTLKAYNMQKTDK